VKPCLLLEQGWVGEHDHRRGIRDAIENNGHVVCTALDTVLVGEDYRCRRFALIVPEMSF
jgi:hypothetical protein